jgi:hypothetical protein
VFSFRILQTSEFCGLMYQLSRCQYYRDRVAVLQYICEPEKVLNLPFLRPILAKATVRTRFSHCGVCGGQNDTSTSNMNVSRLFNKVPFHLNYYFNINTLIYHVDIDITNNIILCVPRVNIIHKKDGLISRNYVSSVEQSSRLQIPRRTQ